MKKVVEDFEFSITAVCARYGMGSYRECLGESIEMRMAFFYTVALQEGMKVDWETGRTYREGR